jgi:hypothetical protein
MKTNDLKSIRSIREYPSVFGYLHSNISTTYGKVSGIRAFLANPLETEVFLFAIDLEKRAKTRILSYNLISINIISIRNSSDTLDTLL